MKEPTWLRDEVVFEMHAMTIRRHGGIAGIRDEGALQSALSRAANQWHYGRAKTIPELAAAYMYGIARNHPFSDGNKRTALSAAVVFMGMNGFTFKEPAVDETVNFVLSVAAGQQTETEIAEWLEQHSLAR